MQATLVRRTPVTVGSRHEAGIDYEDQILFEGTLRDAAAKGAECPVEERQWLQLRSDMGTFSPQEFEGIVSGAAFADLDLAHGSATIRVTAAALNHLRGALPLPMPGMDVICEHLDEINAIVRRKLEADDVITENGKRVLLVDAADVA